MEQFSLEKYLADPSRKVVTRNGRNVRIVCTDRNINNFPIVALIQLYNDSDEEVFTYTKDGKRRVDESTRHDLFFAPEKDKEQRFNPKTLKPFDKVLVRDERDYMWRCAIFSHRNDGYVYPYFANSAWFKYCIPYNEETKHLVGTTEEAPEFYRYWED